MGSTLELRLRCPLTEAAVVRTCEVLQSRLAGGGVRTVVCHLDRVPADLLAVDALARVALVARRAGVLLELRGCGRDLASLLQLVGLTGPLRAPPVAGGRTDAGASGRQTALDHVEQP